MIDIGIIGKGPAGISAAVNAFARNKTVIIFGSDSKKLKASPSIPNYPGFIDINGTDFAEKLNLHLDKTNTTLVNKRVTAVYSMGDSFTIQAENNMYEVKSLILATGVDFKKTIENEDTFLGNGVSYCATCDAPLYKGKETVVIGYNQESIEETKFLSEICKKVYYIPMHRSEVSFGPNVEVIMDKPIKFQGAFKAEALLLENTTINADGFFVIKDSYPLSSLVPGLTVDGPHVPVNRYMETNIPGLFAAGDVSGKPYQIAKAVGEGQMAALQAVEFLAKK